jgi:hypothetical protein
MDGSEKEDLELTGDLEGDLALIGEVHGGGWK